MGLALQLVPNDEKIQDKNKDIVDLIFQSTGRLSSSEVLSSLLQDIRTQVSVPNGFAFGQVKSNCYTCLTSYTSYADFRDYVAHLEMYGRIPETDKESKGNAKELAKRGGSMMFPHLLRHPDDTGWYVPIDFPLPFSCSVRDNSFGSSSQLLKELDRIVESLSLIEPEKYFMGHVSYAVEQKWMMHPVEEYQSIFQVTDWVRHDSENDRDPYSSAKWITSALIWFCKASIHHKVAIAFC